MNTTVNIGQYRNNYVQRSPYHYGHQVVSNHQCYNRPIRNSIYRTGQAVYRTGQAVHRGLQYGVQGVRNGVHYTARAAGRAVRGTAQVAGRAARGVRNGLYYTAQGVRNGVVYSAQGIGQVARGVGRLAFHGTGRVVQASRNAIRNTGQFIRSRPAVRFFQNRRPVRRFVRGY